MMRNLWQGRRSPAGREELAALLPAPGEPVLPPDRRLHLEEHLMREITLEQETRQEATPSAPTPPRRRYRRLALIAAPLAVAVAAGAVVVTQPSDGDGGNAPAPPTAALTLAQVIDHIATTAAGQDLPVPEPDEYVYLETQNAFLSSDFNLDTGESSSVMEDLHRRETWMSPDGREGWLLEPYDELAGGEEGVAIGGGEPKLTNPSYDFLSTLPTDPAELLALIYADGEGEGSDPDERAFSTIGSLLRGQLVPPELSAALYRAAEQIPGVFLVEDVKDAVGNDGLAVARVNDGQRIEWIFDEASYAYLGERIVQVEEDGTGTEPGTVVGYTGIVQIAVVDELRERPAGPSS